MTGFQIRPYAAADRAGCHRVFYRAVHEGAAEVYDAAQRAAWAPVSEPDRRKPDKLLEQWAWVAETAKGEILGFLSLRCDGYLDMAFVLPEARGTAVAPTLLRTLVAKARAEKLDRLTTHASHLARRFLGKHGWQVDFAESAPRNGQTLDRFGMSITLKEDGK